MLYVGIIVVVMYEYRVLTYAYAEGTYQDDRIPQPSKTGGTRFVDVTRADPLSYLTDS